MIQKHFKHIVDELKGLVNDNIGAAPSGMSSPEGQLSDRRFLLAVSGGMDSMCLLHLFMEAYGPGAFAVAHCNFGLRGEESDSDEALVRELVGGIDVPLHVETFDTVSYAERNGISIEMAARELRYRWFARLCHQYGYRYLTVAHHADDNAETLILNLVRGTGLKGMSGMKPVSAIPYSDESLQASLIRPMLGFSRKQIEGYVHKNRINYHDDSTNTSVEYKRNRIRHEVFPVLQKLNPSFINTLNREMVYFSEASEIVDDWCRTAASSLCCADENNDLRISVSRLLALPHWRYLLYHILNPYGFSSPVLASLEDLLTSDRTFSGKTFSSETHELRTSRDELLLIPVDEAYRAADAPLVVSGPGVYSFNGSEFVVELCPWTSDMPLKQLEGTLVFDASALGFPFIIRGWRQGDWILPFGMRGRKKISDMFADLKYDEHEKRTAALLVGPFEDDRQNQRVAALLGVRMDAEYKIGPDTDQIIRIIKK